MTEHFDPTAPHHYGGIPAGRDSFAVPPVQDAAGVLDNLSVNQQIQAGPDAPAAPVAEQPKLTGQEVAQSLTGFEEIAIKQAFGASLEHLDALQIARACCFTLLMRRPGEQRSADCYMTAMQMPQRELQTYFATDDEPDEDDRNPFGEETPAGKGLPHSGPQMSSSPPSAS